MPLRNSPTIHIRTGEPGAGKTIHTINEIQKTHTKSHIFYDNVKQINNPDWKKKTLFSTKINLPNWEKINLFTNFEGIRKAAPNSVIFIDDISYNKEKRETVDLLTLITGLEVSGHIYLALDGTDWFNDEFVEKLYKYNFDHIHYVCGDNLGSYAYQANNLIALLNTRYIEQQVIKKRIKAEYYIYNGSGILNENLKIDEENINHRYIEFNTQLFDILV
ncbi:MAG: ATP-binding protein [Pasteurella sp.]|nr:ATP-binding protein [Pasteurella sp.]